MKKYSENRVITKRSCPNTEGRRKTGRLFWGSFSVSVLSIGEESPIIEATENDAAKDEWKIMKRNVSLEEISDGRLYGKNDMVRAGCGDCTGCSDCCRGMGESIILDPYDVWRMTVGLGCSFAELLQDQLELNVADGLILPNLRMNPKTGACGFLNEAGRCSIHPYRPGICRLFPLGRFYGERTAGAASGETETKEMDGTFRYFLQVHECPKKNKTKVRVARWIDTPQLDRYESYISKWHQFLEAVEAQLSELPEEQVKNVNLFVLKLFFMKPYEPEDFYPQFASRMQMARDVLAIG